MIVAPTKLVCRLQIGSVFSYIQFGTRYEFISRRMAFLFSGRCYSQTRLDGKTAIITGCNTGIGKINVQDFVQRGCKVIMACRNIDLAENAKKDIMASLKNNSNIGEVVTVQLDLASLTSVRKCAQQILKSEERIDILVNNAGVMMCPKSETTDGFEMQIGTNHLEGVNDFDDLNWKKTPYNALQAYFQSKLANVHFTTELSSRLRGTGVTVYAVHPGWVRTDLGRHLDSLYFPGMRMIVSLIIGGFMKSPEQGAQTQIYCAVDEKVGQESGLYYKDCRAVEPHPVAKDLQAASRLWQISEKLVGDIGNPFAAA